MVFFKPDNNYKENYLIFRFLFNLWLIYRILETIIYNKILVGIDNIFPSAILYKKWQNIFVLDGLEIWNNSKFSLLIPIVLLAFLLVNLRLGINRICSFLILILTNFIFLRMHIYLDGGDTVALQLLNYMFLIELTFFSKSRNGQYLNYLSFLCLKIQICLIYLSVAVSKLSGELWMDGTAVYYTLNIDSYTLPIIKELTFKIKDILYVSNFLVLGQQILFPFLVWTKLKKVVVYIGVLVHINIIFINGFVTFGLIMIISYILFSRSELLVRKVKEIDQSNKLLYNN